LMLSDYQLFQLIQQFFVERFRNITDMHYEM